VACILANCPPDSPLDCPPLCPRSVVVSVDESVRLSVIPDCRYFSGLSGGQSVRLEATKAVPFRSFLDTLCVKPCVVHHSDSWQTTSENRSSGGLSCGTNDAEEGRRQLLKADTEQMLVSVVKKERSTLPEVAAAMPNPRSVLHRTAKPIAVIIMQCRSVHLFDSSLPATLVDERRSIPHS
jgi:hypothetical protein